MSNLFYENFASTAQWVAGNGPGHDLVVGPDPLREAGNAGHLSALTYRPISFSRVMNNPAKSYVITFDYLGLPKDFRAEINLGCVLSISDGGSLDGSASLADRTIAYAGAIKNAVPPTCPSTLITPNDCINKCNVPNSGYPICISWSNNYIKYLKASSFIFLNDNRQWNHYSFSFQSSQNNIRLALGDYVYANGIEVNNPGDCYFSNILVTDMSGPSPFIASNSPEVFQAIQVNALGKVANQVSYEKKSAGINVSLRLGIGKLAAEGDQYYDIVDLFGSNFDDILEGDNSDNYLSGGKGNDILIAGTGRDTLVGGFGIDKFVIKPYITKATIKDFDLAEDRLDLREISDVQDMVSLQAILSSSGTSAIINLGSSRSIVLENIKSASISSGNVCFGSSSCGINAPIAKSYSISLACKPGSTLTSTLRISDNVNDFDENIDKLMIRFQTLPDAGILYINSGSSAVELGQKYKISSISYIFKDCEFGTDQLSFYVIDSDGISSEAATINISITDKDCFNGVCASSSSASTEQLSYVLAGVLGLSAVVIAADIL